ncbi:uncharacterized protein M6B38_338800 [Iris pallida]|uniref:Peptidase A1 domain-containing protein n=1 Tax=Iris pallida TaxID=29817 RepID=A0AAX6GZ09_IRIPA|nr:Uncharacterized protein M6B38_242800 [Iris pallida]KAJ6833783.1 uncharacterized protein M6B38_338800 [Iris pallida]
MDVFIGTPPRHFSLILDTGSDLNWLQCAPCRDCFPQRGPLYDPNLSSTYRNLTCRDHSCALVSPPPPDDDDTSPSPCGRDDDHDRTCQYFYWYGDQSNTTGDLAAEAFTVNLTAGNSHLQVDGVVFGAATGTAACSAGPPGCWASAGARCRSPRSCAPSTATTPSPTASSTGTATSS